MLLQQMETKRFPEKGTAVVEILKNNKVMGHRSEVFV